MQSLHGFVEKQRKTKNITAELPFIKNTTLCNDIYLSSDQVGEVQK